MTKGFFAIIDAADAIRVGQSKWSASWSGKNWYARRSLNGGRSWEYLHRFVMNAPPDVNVDHMNGNGLDCRRSVNLRVATQLQNMRNTRIRSDNSSGYKGVSWHKRAGKWSVSISYEGKPTHIGLFADAEIAARAYDDAARRLFGEFARTNFPEVAMHPEMPPEACNPPSELASRQA